MGCISSAPSTDQAPSSFTSVVTTSPTGIVRQVTITLSALEKDDILIAKHGAHYVITGTKFVVDMASCTIKGFLDEAEEFHAELTDEVKAACAKYDMSFDA